MDQTEIDEIIAHIHELRKGTSKQQEPIQKKEPEPVTDDISENLSDDDETFDDETTSDLTNPDQVNVTMMKPEIVGWTDSSKVTCDLCHSEIVLGKNLSGLVVDDEFFACEHCCQTLTRTELMDWTKSKMVSANSVRPIGLWVIEQQNENKSRMK